MLNKDMEIHSNKRASGFARPELGEREADMNMIAERKRLALVRPDLLQEGAFIDGEWVSAESDRKSVV